MVSQRVWHSHTFRYHFKVSFSYRFTLPITLLFLGLFSTRSPIGLAMHSCAFFLSETIAQARSYPREQRFRDVFADVRGGFRVLRELEVHET